MAGKDNILTTTFIKKDGVLKPESPNGLYKLFADALEEGQVVSVFLEANQDDGTNDQLAKIHVCIRKIAAEVGSTFGELKTDIKREAGLIHNGQAKSFSKCSKEELGSVIEAIKVAGDMVNIIC